MLSNNKLKILEKAKSEFQLLSKTSKYKARVYKTIDLLIKILLALFGAVITYFSDAINSNETHNSSILMRCMGILVTSLTALSSVFSFEKRSLSNIQIYTKCKNIIPEIEDKIDNRMLENVSEYIKNIYKELSQLSLASFTDSISNRLIKSDE